MTEFFKIDMGGLLIAHQMENPKKEFQEHLERQLRAHQQWLNQRLEIFLIELGGPALHGGPVESYDRGFVNHEIASCTIFFDNEKRRLGTAWTELDAEAKEFKFLTHFCAREVDKRGCPMCLRKDGDAKRSYDADLCNIPPYRMR